MAELVQQPVTIRLEDGEVKVEPEIRDLFKGEEVIWQCAEGDWEVVFDEQVSDDNLVSPFISEAFGPGLSSSIRATPEAAEPDDEFPRYLSGKRQSVPSNGFDFVYTARLGNGRERKGRVRVFRGVRPH
ncbi:MAG TPA: hypothetical protein VFD58_17900 [Blastocatellia bacterium]|nr:hypothetical protein [Blastocatellia bacterium]